MPFLDLKVNVQVADEQDLAKQLSKVSAETLGKPEAYITVCVTVNKTLTFGGTFEPAFSLSVVSLDNLSTELNEKYSAAFTKFLAEKLGIPNDRGYIIFSDPGRGYLGFQGTTFATIFKS
ncbi:Tautomerase/MIF superfamily [Mycena amicta]|nr:Tautomerase/MIF superfamily [Mycena amicta]